MSTVETIMTIASKIARRPVTDPMLSLRDDVKLDSLDIVEVMTSCEDAFGISLNEEDLVHCKNIKDVAELIDRKRQD
jgi:acyl carrier protein